jgi:hypothetical protein
MTAPTRPVWLISLIVGVIGILIHVRAINVRLGVDDFWLVAGSLILLLVATLMKGL